MRFATEPERRVFWANQNFGRPHHVIGCEKGTRTGVAAATSTTTGASVEVDKVTTDVGGPAAPRRLRLWSSGGSEWVKLERDRCFNSTKQRKRVLTCRASC